MTDSSTAWAGDRSYNLKEGLDWDRIKAEHDARLAAQPEAFVGGYNEDERSIGTGEDRLEQSRFEADLMMATNRPHRRARRNQYSVPQSDVDEMIRLYVDERMIVPDIADRLSYSPHTVRGRLVGAKVYDASRDKGRKPK